MAIVRAHVVLGLALRLAVMGGTDAGVSPTVHITADSATTSTSAVHGGSTKENDLTFCFHLAEEPGGTAACTGDPTHTSETGKVTGALALAEDASLEKDFYTGWSMNAHTPVPGTWAAGPAPTPSPPVLAGTSSSNDFYNGWSIRHDVDGDWSTTADQHTGTITDYVGGTLTPTIAWDSGAAPTITASTSQYVLTACASCANGWESRVINSYSALTRVVTPASGFTVNPAKDTTYGGHATTVYTLTAGTCASMYTARGNIWGAECTGTDDPHYGCTGSGAPAELAGLASNCPAGCKFVGPLNSNELRRSITSPIPCTTVTNTGSGTSTGKLQAPTVLCPKNTVAGVEKGLADIDVRRQTIEMASADTAAEPGQSFQLRDTVVTGVMAGDLTLDEDASATANYYVGWRIETTAPKASGTVLTSSAARVLTVEWDEAKACDTGFARGDPTCVAIDATGVAEIPVTTMAGAAALNAATGSGLSSPDDDGYYNGWTIVADVDGTWGGTDVHTGMIVDFAGDQTVKIDWYTTGDPTGSVPVVHAAAAPTLTASSKYKLRKGTAYTLTANCPAGPKNKNMVVSEEDNTNLLFKPGSLEHWTPDPDNTEALEMAKCTVVRDVDGLFSARMPAGTFTDAGGNPNTISTACPAVTGSYAAADCIHDEPYVVTSDVTVPALTITASDDNWMTTLYSGASAQGQVIPTLHTF